MSPLFFMIIGAILTFICACGLIRLLLEPFVKAFNMYIKRDLSYGVYENSQAQVSLDKGYRLLRNTFSIGFLVGLGLFVYGYIMIFGPRGNAPIYLQNESDNVYRYMSGGYYIPEMNHSYKYVVVISGSDVYLNGKKDDKYVGVNQVSETVSSEIDIYVIDDYAVSSTYHEVVNILGNNKNINIVEKK